MTQGTEDAPTHGAEGASEPQNTLLHVQARRKVRQGRYAHLAASVCISALLVVSEGKQWI